MNRRFINSLGAETLARLSNETLREIAAFPVDAFTRFAVGEARRILARRDYLVTVQE